MMRFIVLLDVDDTCAISNKFYGQYNGGYRYNDALFSALKQAQITEIYLFSSYTLGSVTPILKDEPVGTPSRLKLYRYLEQQGFKIQGVITPLDIVFKKGIGEYYEQVIKPYEAQVLQGDNIRTGNSAKAYQEAFEQETRLRETADQAQVGDKGSLYQYLIAELSKKLLYPNFNVIFVDDRMACLNAVQNANQKYGYPLCLIQAKPQDTASVYQKHLLDFQHDLEMRCMEQQLGSIEIETLDKGQIETYQILHTAFKEVSVKPDKAGLKDLSVKVAYFLTTVQKAKVLSLIAKDAKGEFDNPLLEDKQAERLIESIKAIPGISEISDSTQSQAILYGLEKPYYVSLETVANMLRKINTTGNSRVGRVGNVFFKQGAEYSLVEQAVYQLSRLFGEGVVTPTRLLLLKVPNEGTYTLQASLGVGVDLGMEAIGLDELCNIPEAIAALKQALGEAQFAKDFPTLLSNEYYKAYLEKWNYVADMAWEEQCSLVLKALLQLPQEQWPVELKEAYQPYQYQQDPTVELLLDPLQEALKGTKAPLRVLALLERYPQFSEDFLNNLIVLCDVFECLSFLYPSLCVEAVLKETECLLSYISKGNLSSHLLLDLLSEARDHKGDNFKVQFRRDSHGNLMAPLEIIAIDNDDSMRGVFQANTHQILVKTLLFANRVLLNEPIAESIRQRYLSINPKVVIMQWLEALHYYYQPYSFLKENKVIFEGLSRTLRLNEQVPVDFVDRLLKRLEIIQAVLSKGVVTHAELLIQVEPLLAYAYQELSKHYPNPQRLMTVLYNKAKPVSLEDVLTDRLDKTLENGKTLQSLIAELAISENNYQSYVETLTQYIEGSLAVNHPLQAYALILCLRLKTCYISLPPQGLVLSVGTLVKAYSNVRQELIYLMKHCSKIALQLKEQVLLNNPMILYYAMREPQRVPLVQALLACGVGVNLARTQDGLTLLHFAACFYPECIPVLIAGGLDTEIKDHRGITSLEMAMHFNHGKAVILLLQHGAGQDLSVPLGLAFVKDYQTLCPELCQSLLSRNIAMAWYLALDRVSQEKLTPEAVSIMGIKGKRYLRSEIYQEIFKGGRTFPKDNIHGVRSVTSMQVQVAEGIGVGLHLKEYPELPGREIMVHLLAKHLFGLITPSIALWRFSKESGILFLKKEVAYPVLASRSIAGKLLLDVLTEDPQQLKKLDKRSVYEAIVLAMMINPEDGRADNYILQSFSKGSEIAYRLVSIDNDHAFVRPIALKKNGEESTETKSLQVKTILYCLEEMRDALPQDMVKQLLAYSPYDLLKNWLVELQQQQKQIHALFNETERKHLKAADIHVDILFKFSIVADIYQKLCRLQAILREDPRTPLLGILRGVIPELWVRYAGVFQQSQYSTPLERFNVLTKDCFEMKVVRKDGKNHLYPGSTAKAYQVLQMTQNLRDEEQYLKDEQEGSSESALMKLDKLHSECQALALEEIFQELQKGEVVRFKKLPNVYQERIVNGDGVLPGIDFDAMMVLGKPDTRRQQTVLSALQGVPFRVLKIKNYKALTDRQFSTLLQYNKSLLALSLEGCSNLTVAALQIIANTCLNLEKLVITKLLWSHVRVSFPMLRVLYVHACPRLVAWEMQESSIVEQLYFKDCQRLSNLNIRSTRLREIELQNCQILPEAQLKNLSLDSTLLEKVQLDGCVTVLNAHFYQKYPKLFNLALYGFNREFVELLDTEIEGSLRELDIPADMMQSSMIEQLQVNLELLRFKSVHFLPLCLKTLKDDINLDIRKEMGVVLAQLPLTLEDKISAVSFILLQILKNEDVWRRNEAREVLSKLLPGNMVLETSLFIAEVSDRSIEIFLQLPLTAENKAAMFVAISSINKNKAEMLRVLLKALLEENKEDVRNSASEVLSTLPLTAKDKTVMLPILLKALGEKNLEGRKSASEVLRRLPLTVEDNAVVIPVLLQALRDENRPFRKGVVKALSELPLRSEDKATVVLPALLNALNENGYARRGALEALLKLPLTPDDKSVVLPIFLNVLRDKDSKIKSDAVEALSKLPLLAEDKSTVLPLVLKVLEDKNACATRGVIAVLSKLPLVAEDKVMVVLPILLKMLIDKDGLTRRSAIEALSKLSLTLEYKTLVVLPALLKALLKEPLGIKRSVMEVLSGLPLVAEDIPMVLPVLLKALQDEDAHLRKSAGEILSKRPLLVAEDTLMVLPVFLKVLQDEDEHVRKSASEVLLKLPLVVEYKPMVLSVLLKVLEDKDDYVRRSASEVLSRLPLTVEDRRLVVLPELLKNLSNESLPVKRGASEALSKLSLTAQDNTFLVLPFLLKALKDKNFDVSRDASEALSKLPLSAEEQTKMVFELFEVLQKADQNHVRHGAGETLSKLLFASENRSKVLSILLGEDKKKNWDELSFARGLHFRSTVEMWSKLSLTAKEKLLVVEFLQKQTPKLVNNAKPEIGKALSKLARMRGEKLELLPTVLEAIEGDSGFFMGDYERRSEGSEWLMSEKKPVLSLVVLQALGDENIYLRRGASAALKTRLLSAEDTPMVLPLLLRALRDTDEFVRTNVSKALVNFPLAIEDKASILPELFRRLGDITSVKTEITRLLVSFYPSTNKQAIKEFCQKFKKAYIAPMLTHISNISPENQMHIVQDTYVQKQDSVAKFRVETWKVDPVVELQGNYLRNQTINVSGQGNNCGLFALILGIKQALGNKPQLRSKTRIPEFFDSFDTACLQSNRESQETVVVGTKLRQELYNALLQDAQYKIKRYPNFVNCCRETLGNKSSAIDMQAWLKVTKEYREELKTKWSEINDFLKQSYNTREEEYYTLLNCSNNTIHPENIELLKIQLSVSIAGQPNPKELYEVLKTFYPSENNSMLRLIKLRRLYRSAWLGVTSGSGLERNKVSDCIETIFKQEILAILQQPYSFEEFQKNLLLLALLENTHFDENGAFANNANSREEVLSTAIALFVENDLPQHWDNIYQNYCEYIKIGTEMLSADELGCLACYWSVQLKIQFTDGRAPYMTYQVLDLEQLQITLCNPSRIHWQVVCIETQEPPTHYLPRYQAQESSPVTVHALSRSESEDTKSAELRNS